MANQLAIPSKKTSSTLPIKAAVREYIRTNHPDTHPDAFSWDIDRWEQLRREATEDVVRLNRVETLLKYNAQLSFVSTKLPDDIGLDIPYLPAFRPTSPWLTLPSLAYERCAILFNLASLYSHLARAEDRSHSDGIKRANALYKCSAGVFKHIVTSALPALLKSSDIYTHDSELSEPLLKGLEYLMLAQAQECAWQLAAMDRFKNNIIAKLASGVSHFYRMCASTISEAPTNVKQPFPKEWLSHVQTKGSHFEAAAQYRMSLVDLEQHRYGHELARLTEAKEIAQKAYDTARKQLVARPVLNDAKSLLEIVEKNLTRAERDNDLIYHQDIPARSALSSVDMVVLVSSDTPKELAEPKNVVGSNEVLFGELAGWGARVAIEIYQHRREQWLKDEVYSRAAELDDIAAKTLNELRLPASLEALDKPVGLPPSLLRKAEEVRLEDGPSRIDGSFDAVDVLAERNRAILDEAMDLLDQEASEDEGIRKTYAASQKYWDRLPSYEANLELTGKERRYRQLLDQAAESDDRVRDKWNSWEGTIVRLTWDEEELERWVPKSTTSHSGRRDTQNAQTQTHARALRGHLESLEDIRRSRASLVERVQRLVEADDIRPRIMREEANIAQWTEVTPAMFEMTVTEEMEKYDRFKDDVEEGALKQEEILEHIKARNEQFLQSRKEDPSVREREHALQSLDLAYYKYKEIVRNLEEGLNFYNDLARILTSFKEACKEWVRIRRDEMRSLSMLESMSLSTNEDDDVSTPKSRPRDLHASVASPTRRGSGMNAAGFDLPPPDSDEWESLPSRR